MASIEAPASNSDVNATASEEMASIETPPSSSDAIDIVNDEMVPDEASPSNSDVNNSEESPASLDVQVQQELAVHSSASREILTYLCQRLAQLETALASLQTEITIVRADAQRETQDVRRETQVVRHETQDVRREVASVQTQVENMVTQLNGYANAVNVVQSEMHTHTNSLSWLSSSLTDEHGRVNDVHERVDNQRDDFNSRFSELSLKLDDIPRALAALQATAPSPLSATRDDAGFTFRSAAANDKLLLQTHVHRRGSSQRSGSSNGGPYTDLQSFTIPDDMKAKVEARIRAREQCKEDADAAAGAELSDAYRRLMLASNNPRLSDVHIQVDACQAQLKHAYQLIRDSNLHLYSCCEAKADKMDVVGVQSELKALRSRLRELEIAGTYRGRHPPAALSSSSPSKQLSQLQPKGFESLVVSTVKDRTASSNNNNKSNSGDSIALALGAGASHSSAPLSTSQIPELRVCLLELSRNFNVLQRQWTTDAKTKQRQPLNPVVKVHMEKVVAMIADAYSATAEEPVDLDSVAHHVDKVSRVLGSDFSMHVLGTLGYSNAHNDALRRSIDAKEVVPALCRYSELVTDSLRVSGSPVAAATAGAAPHKESDERCAPPSSIDNDTRSLDRLSRDMDELVRNQRRLEAALSALVNTTTGGSTSTAEADDSTSSTAFLTSLHPTSSSSNINNNTNSNSSAVTDELRRLRDEIATIRTQFVSEDTLSGVLRQLELWKAERDRLATNTSSAVVVGHRYSGSLFKRHNSASEGLGSSSDLLDALERPTKSQPKLDPLLIHKMSGEVRPSRTSTTTTPQQLPTTNASSTASATMFTTRSTPLRQIQARASMLRPRTNAQPPPQ